VYLASPGAARSPWVNREITYWKAHRPLDQFIILLTDGELVWNSGEADFDHERSSAIPDVLHGVFPGEPYYLDMRWTRGARDLCLEHPRFKAQVIQLAATLRNVTVADMVGEESQQHRRTVRVRNAAIATLTLLMLAATGAAIVAFKERAAAVYSASIAKEQQSLAEQSADAARADR
jgi:hypothetical protein